MRKQLPLFAAVILAASWAPALALAQIDLPGHAAPGIGLLLAGTLVLIASVFIYFLPAFVAFRRGHPSRWAILLVNLFFGASIVGWIIALIWALSAVTVVVVNQVSPPGSRAR
jgi:hypothetical protein